MADAATFRIPAPLNVAFGYPFAGTVQVVAEDGVTAVDLSAYTTFVVTVQNGSGAILSTFTNVAGTTVKATGTLGLSATAAQTLLYNSGYLNIDADGKRLAIGRVDVR